LAVAACTGPPTPTSTETPDAETGDTTVGGSVCPAGTTVDADFCVSPDADPALRDVVADVFAADGLAAVIAGIWKDGEPVLVGAMGDSFPGDAATIDMHHLLGNWATPMLSTVLLQQVDAGVVALDDPLSNWLPDVPEADQITLEMLARSTSGFAQYTSFPDFADSLVANPFRRFSPEEIYAFGVKDGTTFPPGTDWRFSDTNFILLGAALEAATGKPVSELMRAGIWEPLGLDGMTPPTDSRKAQPVLHGFGNPRGPWEDLTYWTPTWIGYAGGVSGNQEEVARFIEALAEGSLVSAESHEEQFANASLGMTGNTEEKYYAMGFSVVDGWIFNNPNLPGYRGGAGHFDGWTIVVYTTQGIDGDPDAPSPTTIFERLSEILVPDQPMIYSD
jgi:D-alanyl-D-alanine carboxypeptidase